jgi:hypothetical protein
MGEIGMVPAQTFAPIWRVKITLPSYRLDSLSGAINGSSWLERIAMQPCRASGGGGKRQIFPS